MIEDVKCAVRYLRVHAVSYNLDPSKIGAVGASAGGHLAALLGLTDDKDFNVGDYSKYSSRVQVVVDLFGPTDLAPEYARKLFFDPTEVFGASDGNDTIFFDASPVNYVTPDDPPILIFHGNLDETVPPLQSKMLFKALQAEGVPSEYVVVKKAGHNFEQLGQEPISPSLEEVKTKIMAFLELHLK
jgi:acetyl esterase/lipase